MTSPEESAGIRAAQERTKQIGQVLGKKFEEGALRQSFNEGLADGKGSIAPSTKDTGKSAFTLAAEQGTLPGKSTIVEEDKASVERRRVNVRKGSTG